MQLSWNIARISTMLVLGKSFSLLVLQEEQAEVFGVFLTNFLSKSELCLHILEDVLLCSENDQYTLIQFVLDCSALPIVIAASQKEDTVLRSFWSCVHSLHRTMLKLMALEQISVKIDQLGHYNRWF